MSTTTKQIPYKPAQRSCYAVWEITLKCNLACNHCGSRAGDARVNELSTAEALDLVAEEINRCGMICSMTTGGYGISRTIAERMKQAGINQVSISVDGMKHTHDRLRGTIGSWTYAFKSMQHLNAVGIPFGANTQVNRHSAPEFPRLYEALVDAGAKDWLMPEQKPGRFR